MRGVGEEFECEFLELERILNLRGVGEEFEDEFLERIWKLKKKKLYTEETFFKTRND